MRIKCESCAGVLHLTRAAITHREERGAAAKTAVTSYLLCRLRRWRRRRGADRWEGDQTMWIRAQRKRGKKKVETVQKKRTKLKKKRKRRR